MTDEVARRLKAKAGIRGERLVTCSTHTHCAPALASGLDFIFGAPIPRRPESADRTLHQGADRRAWRRPRSGPSQPVRPGRLAWGQGSVALRGQPAGAQEGQVGQLRRQPERAGRHSLPVLRVTDPAGKVRAVLVGYACHCTTLGRRVQQDLRRVGRLRLRRDRAAVPRRDRRWRSSAAGPTPTPSPGGTSTTPGTTRRPLAREADRVLATSPHPPARPADARSSARSSCPSARGPSRDDLEKRDPSSPAPKGSSPGR